MQQDAQHLMGLINNNLIINIGDDTSLDNSEYYDQILFLKREDDNLEKGIWQRPLIEPQWKEIIDICQNRLKLGPDLVLGARYAEACSKLYQLDGFLAGMITIKNICKFDYLPHSIEKRQIVIDWINSKLKNNLYLIHTLLKDTGISSKHIEMNNQIIEISTNLSFDCSSIKELCESFKLSTQTIDAYTVNNDHVIEEPSADFFQGLSQKSVTENKSINNVNDNNIENKIKHYFDQELKEIKEDLSNIAKNLDYLIKNK